MTIKTKVGGAVLAAAVSFAGTIALAAPQSATFDFFNANSTGTQTALQYTVNGLTVDMKTTGGNGKIEIWKGAGLGAPTDSHHQIDSYGIAETINFHFSQAVKFITVTFNPTYIQSWDKFAFSEEGVQKYTGAVTATFDLSSYSGISDDFGIGAVGYEDILGTYTALHDNANNACEKLSKTWDSRKGKYKYNERCYSAFKITSITASWDDDDGDLDVVPLPAAGFLLVGGLGALAALRRRKRA